MSKLLSLVRKTPKRTSAVLLMIAAAVIVPAALFAWGPSRTTFTIEKPATYVTFNSITNNPSHGDERNFSQVREVNASNTTYSDAISLEAGHEYVVYVYYHNNAASNYNASGVGIAKGAYVKSQVPAVVAKGSTGTKAVSYVGASNSNPGEVWDDISFSNPSTGDIALRFVPGSATIHNFGKTNGQTLSDNIVTTGAPIGYDALDGVLPGCNEYSGYVTYRVKADQPNFTVSKQVHKTDTTGWKETEAVKPGDSVDYLVTYKNTGTTDQNNVVINDILPAGVTYTSGTTSVANATNPSGIKVGDNVTKGGINIGNYSPGAAAYIKFTAKVADNDNLPTCGSNTLHNIAKAQTNNGTKEDSADVTVPKECKPVAAYTCDALAVTRLTRTSMRFTTSYTVKESTFKSVTYVIKDASGKVIDTKTSTEKTLDYTQNTAGKYTVQATITVTVDGKDATATSEGCKASFEITDTPVVPAYTCDALAVTRLTRTSMRFTTSYTVKDATFTGVVYIIKDVNGKIVDTKTSAEDTLEYTQSTVGKYTVQATITAIANGKDVTATSEGCKVAFEIPGETTPPVTPPVTPETPSELPKTGAGEAIASVIGLGALISSLGYYIASRRSL